MRNEREIIISVSDKVPTETLFYIVDCWVEFVVCDLGLEPNDLMMILPDIDQNLSMVKGGDFQGKYYPAIDKH